MSVPLSEIDPAKCFVTPTMVLISVVLPAPLRPRMASDCPAASDRSMPFRITARPYPAEIPASLRYSGIGVFAKIDRTHPRIF